MSSAPDTHHLSISCPDRKKTIQRRPSAAHYRPVSTILCQAAAERQQLPSISESRLRLSLRPLSLTGESVRGRKMKELIKDRGRISLKSLPKRESCLRSISPLPVQGDRIFSPQNLISKLKMKRSMSSLYPATLNSQLPNDAASSLPFPSLNSSTPDLSKPTTNNDKWIRKDYATLHPYSHEAPYMQAYDPILLDKYVAFHTWCNIFMPVSAIATRICCCAA